MYENWTQKQREQATGRWVSTEHEGAPPDTSVVLVHTSEFGDPDAKYAVGYYNDYQETWHIGGWLGMENLDGYKAIAYWRLLPGREN